MWIHGKKTNFIAQGGRCGYMEKKPQMTSTQGPQQRMKKWKQPLVMSLCKGYSMYIYIRVYVVVYMSHVLWYNT
jgi:hypothetical protein